MQKKTETFQKKWIEHLPGMLETQVRVPDIMGSFREGVCPGSDKYTYIKTEVSTKSSGLYKLAFFNKKNI